MSDKQALDLGSYGHLTQVRSCDAQPFPGGCWGQAGPDGFSGGTPHPPQGRSG